MARKKRIYSTDFKLKALQMLNSSGKSAAQIERELGITPGLLSQWSWKYIVVQQGDEPARLIPMTNQNLQTEYHRLQKEIAKVREECDILKKIMDQFGPHDA
jgi:transposase